MADELGGARLWHADMATQTLKDLGIEEGSILVGPHEFIGEMVSENFLYEEPNEMDLRDYLSTLDPFCEDDQPEWDRVAAQLEYDAAVSDWSQALYEEEYEREQENLHALQEDREDFFAERDC